MTKAAAAALAAFLSMPGEAHADGAFSTMEMMQMCKPVVDAVILPDGKARVVTSFEGGMCYGVFLTLQFLSFTSNDGSLHNERRNQNESALGACPPAGVNILQMVRVFDAYARQHPEIQHQDFIVTALTALRSAFPCK